MLSNRPIGILLLALIAALTASPALAHTGPHLAGGFGAGVAHPFLGLDHVLAMLSVGALGAAIGRRATWLVPACFIALMAAGAGLAFSGVSLAYVETAIAVSLVVFGALIAGRVGLSGTLAASIVGGFALFHGYAHGAELPELAGQTAYAAGFLVATGLLHGVGIVLMRLANVSGPVAQASIRLGGFAIAVVGVAAMLV